MSLTITGVEKRLQARYERLVQEHTGHAHPGASGPRVLPSEHKAQADAMAAWRFFHNRRITFPQLAEPLLRSAADSAARRCREFALVPLDWSWLKFNHHASRSDCLGGPKGVRGYKLLSALLLGDHDGQPLAPLLAQLQTAKGLFPSRLQRRTRPRPTLDELTRVMGFVQGQRLAQRPVFIIDAEADSVYHYRDWHQRGWLFVVRADEERVVRLDSKDGPEKSLRDVRQTLRRRGACRRVRTVDYHGRQVGPHVAEQAVVLDRVAWLNRTVDGQRKRLCVPGVALKLRLIVTELRDDNGRLLERWYLLTNVPESVSAATVALWYYWRWEIETFFRLLKSAGQQVGHWQQEDGATLLKRLLVASMACVLAWRLGHSQAPRADEVRRRVMRLSGRQSEHNTDWTLEGLLVGTWVLLAAAALLEDKTDEQVKDMAAFVLAGSVEPDQTTSPPLREAG